MHNEKDNYHLLSMRDQLWHKKHCQNAELDSDIICMLELVLQEYEVPLNIDHTCN
jgi:hypothetical protein